MKIKFNTIMMSSARLIGHNLTGRLFDTNALKISNAFLTYETQVRIILFFVLELKQTPTKWVLNLSLKIFYNVSD